MSKMKTLIFLYLSILISCNVHQINVMREITYSQLGDGDRMITFYWENFGINSNEIITQVQFEIFTKKTKIGNWQGAFGTSTINEPNYWYITENMIQTINDKEGIIIWNIPEDLRKNIKYHSEGIFQFGIWWIDCDSFTIRNINIITS